MPTASALAAALSTLAPVLNTTAAYPLSFTPAELETLATGGVAKRRERMADADRVVGALWTEASRDALWVAIEDDKHYPLVEGLVDEQLSGTTRQTKVLYQRVDLPWPLADRQWVIDVRDNPELFTVTGGIVWERTWTPSLARGAKAETKDALWVTVNDGGWLLIDALGGTLVAYHARSVVNGNVPNDLATSWSYAGLDEMLGRIVQLASQMNHHYDASHDPVFRPDGSTLPPAR